MNGVSAVIRITSALIWLTLAVLSQPVYAVDKCERIFDYHLNLDASDPFEILGLSGDASKAEVSTAFKYYARIYHPDKNESSVDSTKAFAKISDARDRALVNIELGERRDFRAENRTARGSSSRSESLKIAQEIESVARRFNQNREMGSAVLEMAALQSRVLKASRGRRNVFLITTWRKSLPVSASAVSRTTQVLERLKTVRDQEVKVDSFVTALESEVLTDLIKAYQLRGDAFPIVRLFSRLNAVDLERPRIFISYSDLQRTKPHRIFTDIQDLLSHFHPGGSQPVAIDSVQALIERSR